MCIFFIYHSNSRTHFPWKLVLASNRDEMVTRPTKEAHLWPVQSTYASSSDQLLAGQDCTANGTWLGVTLKGKLSLLTNRPFRPFNNKSLVDSIDGAVCTPEQDITPFRSRGKLVTDFLLQNDGEDEHDALSISDCVSDHGVDDHLSQYLEAIQCDQDDYAGFNLLVGNILMNQYLVFSHEPPPAPPFKRLASVYNVNNILTQLEADTPHVVSNAGYPYYNPEHWPKIASAETIFAQLINDTKAVMSDGLDAKALFNLLSDKQEYQPPSAIKKPPAKDDKINTRHYICVPPTVKPEGLYATRTSTIILVDHQNNVTFAERNWDPAIGDGSHPVNVQLANQAHVYQFSLADNNDESACRLTQTYWHDLTTANQ
ncbi:NRDE protein-domain-containing protein [Syncephalis fuscata]|nr:NRDE protein-domain-containing protein [Syncephalis fuscata]